MKEILSTRVRFGAFELDLKAGELRKGSRTLLLQEQPLRVLQMIVERGGELATRQEIQKKLWPNDTVVDFDHGINTAIKKIRQALGDSADNPKYIQTVARRGYRLLVPIEWIDAGTPGQSDQEEIDGRSVKATPSAGDLTGKKVSHYRVLEVLGGGGMGVVYKAEDLKLGRAVAMKFLPEELGDDPKAKERFEREARAASALDHPNICSIYEFGEYEGRPFIVMQFLAGQNLRDLLADSRNDRGHPFRVDELLDLAIQITAGLGAAHEKGIIHRDIKPANIFITNRREAKVLDFGVAKMLDVAETVESAEANSSPSGGPNGDGTTAPLTVHLTRTGVALGTEGYMSPEQIRAERLDARSDLFSFGLVLYEMATGQRAFRGDTAAELHEAILHQAPVAPRELNPEIPPEVEAIICRCLEKERERRYQSAEELIGALEGLPEAASNASTSQPADGGTEPTHLSVETALSTRQAKPRSLRPWWLLTTAVFIVGLVSLIWYLRRPLPPPLISRYTQITHDGRMKWPAGTDGSRIYFAQASPTSIAQVGIAGGEVVQIPVPVPFLNAFDDVSPDGSNLLVESLNEGNRNSRGLWNFRIPGGPLRRLAEDFDAAYSPDGKSVIYSTPSGDIYLVGNDGSGTHKLASIGPKSPDVSSFSWSPDGHFIRFSSDDKLWQMSSGGSNLHQLIPGWRFVGGQWGGRWTPDGRFFVFVSGNSATGGTQIWALDERRGLFRRPPAEPVQLTTGPLSWDRPIPAKDGKSIFAEGTTSRGELSRFDAKSKEFQRFLGGISAEDVTFSKDGQSVAYVSFPEGILWKANRDGSNPIQLSDPPLDVFMPRWSPDGTQILFSDISSSSEIYIVAAQGGTPRKLLPEGSGKQSDPDWSADGHKVVFGTTFGAHDPKGQIRIFDLDSQKITTLSGSLGMTGPRWSPDGQFIAAPSFDLHTVNIFDVGTQRWSALPLKMEMAFQEWSRDSRFIYFMQAWGDDRGVYRIRVKGGDIEKVVGLKDFHIAGRFLEWTGLDPTDAPLLLRDIGSSDIYSLTLDQK